MGIREELIKELARKSYVDYVEYVHEGRWIRAKHLERACEDIDLLIDNKLYNDKGDNVQFLIVEMPPQHGKSQSITETLPSYYLGKFPMNRVIEASYGDDLARKFGRRNKQKIKQFGKELFNVSISKSSDSDTEFEIEEHKGTMISRGIMAGITGQPAELIIVDDPVKNRQEADSPTYRERMKEEFLNSILTRLSANGKLIIVQTRWHEDDLAGWVKDNFKRVKTITFTCEAEDNDILGRTKGDALFPEIGKDNEWLKNFKEAYTTKEGSRAWNALFQQRPTTLEGNLIKRKWWQYYKELPCMTYNEDGTIKNKYAGMVHMIMSVDATFKDGDTNDYVAIQVWGKRDTKEYLIDRLKERMDFPTTLQAIKTMKAKYPMLHQIIIEDKANGSAIISMLKKEIQGIIPVNPLGGKIARANAVSPMIEAGEVYLPEQATWVYDFIDEWSSFPNAEHDDEVDCGTQALSRLRTINASVKELTEAELIAQRKWKQKVEGIAGGTATRSFIKYGG